MLFQTAPAVKLCNILLAGPQLPEQVLVPFVSLLLNLQGTSWLQTAMAAASGVCWQHNTISADLAACTGHQHKRLLQITGLAAAGARAWLHCPSGTLMAPHTTAQAASSRPHLLQALLQLQCLLLRSVQLASPLLQGCL